MEEIVSNNKRATANYSQSNRHTNQVSLDLEKKLLPTEFIEIHRRRTQNVDIQNVEDYDERELSNEPRDHPNIKLSSFSFVLYFLVNICVTILLMIIRSSAGDTFQIMIVQIYYAANIIPALIAFYLIKKVDEVPYLLKKTRIPNIQFRIEYNYFYVYTTQKKGSKATFLIMDAGQIAFAVIFFIYIVGKTYSIFLSIVTILTTLLCIFRAVCILYLFTYRAKIAERRQKLI